MKGDPREEIEELNSGDTVAAPRQAASVIVLRGGDRMLELLLVQRTLEARFMAGAWVFPGGAVDAHEGEGDESHRLAAVRELEEEAGITGVDPAALVKFSRWITPKRIATRFDTHFFLAHVPGEQTPSVDGSEIIDWRWFTPAGALAEYEVDRLKLVYPTIKHLEQLSEFPTAAALLDYAGRREVVPVVPRVVMHGEVARVLLPGDPGYDAPPDES